MPTIKVRVSGKIAENLTPEVKIVCRNSDYKVEFEFDEPWKTHDLKTALFVYNGASVPVPFSGNVCEMPELYNTTLCAIGVFAGDLITTTPAYVDCLKAISDLGGEMPPPTEDVYNKLVQMIESGMLKGEQGEKGEKGDTPVKGLDYWTEEEKKEITDYVDKEIAEFDFVKVVDTLPETGLVNREYFVRKTDGAENDLFDEYKWINSGTEETPVWGWEYVGTKKIEIDLTDYVKFTDYATESKAGVFKTADMMGIAVNTNTGVAFIAPASTAQIDGKTVSRLPITPENLDHAVKVGITTNTETLTDEEKGDACEWLGAVPKLTGAPSGYGVMGTEYQNNTIKYWNMYPRVAFPDWIPQYDANANISTSTPVLEKDCINKKYFDENIAKNYRLIETITLTEDTKTIERSQEPDGTAYNFKDMFIAFSCTDDMPAGSVTNSQEWTRCLFNYGEERFYIFRETTLGKADSTAKYRSFIKTENEGNLKRSIMTKGYINYGYSNGETQPDGNLEWLFTTNNLTKIQLEHQSNFLAGIVIEIWATDV